MTSPEAGKPVEILLIEDNPEDIRLIQDTLKNGKVLNHMQVVKDGVEAMVFLKGKEPHANRQRPDLILLDLNIPKKDGREVLQDIKQDPDLRRIPVVILTISMDQQDVFKSYELHANAYITKPMDLDGFLQVVKMLEGFWLSIVTVPPHTTN